MSEYKRNDVDNMFESLEKVANLRNKKMTIRELDKQMVSYGYESQIRNIGMALEEEDITYRGKDLLTMTIHFKVLDVDNKDYTISIKEID